MKFDNLFPTQYRAFFRGELSFCVERFGGIDTINLLDIREFDGKFYPDRMKFPWLCRNMSSTMGRPLYSPAIQFRYGRKLYVPENAKLYPFGFKTDSYSMVVGNSAASFRFHAPEKASFSMMISKFHIYEGNLPTLHNQLAVIASGIQLLPDELRGEGFDRNYPFGETDMKIVRKKPVFKDNMLIFEAVLTFSDHVKSKFWVVSSDKELKFNEITNNYILSSDNADIDLGFGFADDLETAIELSGMNFDAVMAESMEMCESALSADIADLPAAADFVKVYPAYQRHLVLAETDSELSIRAAADKFGFFALWDHIYPIRDMLVIGEYGKAKKALRYMMTYPWSETCPWVTLHWGITLAEYLAYTQDYDFLTEAMPFLRESFEFNKRFVNEKTGLLATTLNVGVDCSAEVGITGLFYASCINGWWYDSLRSLENLALYVNDDKLASECREISEKVDEHYQEAFFVPQVGYLRAARKGNGDVPDIEIFQNTHTIGMDYPFGAYLFRKIVKSLSAYQADALYHPMGHCAVAPESDIPCEMWKSVHMNQHLGHECKIARHAGNSAEAERVMAGYLEYFKKYHTAVETFNLAGCTGDTSQLGNWQAFSATAAMQALFSAIGGWEIDRGGWHWVWGGGSESVFKNINGKDFAVRGKGAFASGIYVDGKFAAGSMQIPSDIDGRRICVERTDKKIEHAVLLSAVDAMIKDVKIESGILSFIVCNDVHSAVKCYAPEYAFAAVNGKEVAETYHAGDNTFYFNCVFKAGDRVEIKSYKNM